MDYGIRTWQYIYQISDIGKLRANWQNIGNFVNIIADIMGFTSCWIPQNPI